ncbi:hypothetical protein BB560_002916 [Smittium megazygosporum]|uniref:Uncharacterized protein n=1 Tax=Smittium megazygosporum TaxID=133381 RepID=A0A2T9ZDG6_9FUNG|nr:hypothetical protein BB560_002916 [Smittium megazygosporum]
MSIFNHDFLMLFLNSLNTSVCTLILAVGISNVFAKNTSTSTIVYNIYSSVISILLMLSELKPLNFIKVFRKQKPKLPDFSENGANTATRTSSIETRLSPEEFRVKNKSLRILDPYNQNQEFGFESDNEIIPPAFISNYEDQNLNLFHKQRGTWETERVSAIHSKKNKYDRKLDKHLEEVLDTNASHSHDSLLSQIAYEVLSDSINKTSVHKFPQISKPNKVFNPVDEHIDAVLNSINDSNLFSNSISYANMTIENHSKSKTQFKPQSSIRNNLNLGSGNIAPLKGIGSAKKGNNPFQVVSHQGLALKNAASSITIDPPGSQFNSNLDRSKNQSKNVTSNKAYYIGYQNKDKNVDYSNANVSKPLPNLALRGGPKTLNTGTTNSSPKDGKKVFSAERAEISDKKIKDFQKQEHKISTQKLKEASSSVKFNEASFNSSEDRNKTYPDQVLDFEINPFDSSYNTTDIKYGHSAYYENRSINTQLSNFTFNTVESLDKISAADDEIKDKDALLKNLHDISKEIDSDWVGENEK